MKDLYGLTLCNLFDNIDFCDNVDERLFEYLDPMVYNSLEFLNIGGTKVESSIAYRLPQFKKLEYLTLDNVNFNG
jgi:hypothetical protein